MTCKSCQERRDMLKKAAEQAKSRQISAAVKTTVAVGRHFVHNPPSFVGENMKNENK